MIGCIRRHHRLINTDKDPATGNSMTLCDRVRIGALLQLVRRLQLIVNAMVVCRMVLVSNGRMMWSGFHMPGFRARAMVQHRSVETIFGKQSVYLQVML